MKAVNWFVQKWYVWVLLFIGGLLFYGRQQKKAMHTRAKFTVGSLDGWYHTAKSGRFFNFNFVVNNSLYSGSNGWQAGMNEADKARYLVEYDSLAPEVNVGHFDVPIPDSLRAPANGWRVPPVRVPARLLGHGKGNN
ncbi:MAG: hypothetical protein ACRYFR_18905 [Janthinobacterium lividum]